MKKIIAGIVFIVLLLVVSIPCHALRWGTGLIQEGDHSCIVLQKCGEPKYKEVIREGIKRSKIEHWMYERSGMYYVFVFKGGILTEIKSIRK